jgi:hypothetical protein
MKQNIFRIKKNTNFSVICNFHLRDKSLSWKAKGLLTYILTLPDDWKLYIKELTGHCRDGRDGTANALRELIKSDYVRRSRTCDGSGKITGYEYTIYEMPFQRFTEIDTAEKRQINAEKPVTPFPFTDKPFTENPSLLNTNCNQILTEPNTDLASNDAEKKEDFFETWLPEEKVTEKKTIPLKALKIKQPSKTEIALALSAGRSELFRGAWAAWIENCRYQRVTLSPLALQAHMEALETWSDPMAGVKASASYRAIFPYKAQCKRGETIEEAAEQCKRVAKMAEERQRNKT